MGAVFLFLNTRLGQDCEVEANLCCIGAVLFNARLGWEFVKSKAAAAVWGGGRHIPGWVGDLEVWGSCSMGAIFFSARLGWGL